jgi:hypothetical protein
MQLIQKFMPKTRSMYHIPFHPIGRHMQHPRAYLLIAIVLPVALVSAACGSRTVGTARIQATASASPSVSPSPTVSPPAVAIDAAHLISGSTGWALSDNALSLTSDDGLTWNSITPPGVPAATIRGVYFLDPQHGWVVSSDTNDPAQLEISSTADGGGSWSTADLGSPAPDFANSTAEPAYIDFVDQQHGWVMVLAAGSDAGYLFQTTDGGATWQQLPRPIGGPIEFVSPTTGWLTSADQQGTIYTEKVYVTSDGGQSWTPETVTPPTGYTQDQATYTLPSFTTPANVIVVAFDNGTDSAAGFYQTTDNGTSWQLAATVPAGNPNGDVSPSAAIVDSSHWITINVNGTTVTNVTDSGSSVVTTTPVGLPKGGEGPPSFTTPGNGWALIHINQCVGSKTDCTEITTLYRSTDFGADWVESAVP